MKGLELSFGPLMEGEGQAALWQSLWVRVRAAADANFPSASLDRNGISIHYFR